jgi:molecular chaperone IbpA
MVTTRAIANIFDQFDRTALTPYAVGFDRMFDRLHDHYALHQTNTGFPPYNIRTEGDYNYVIEMALAGLSKDDLEVQVAEQTLTVCSLKKEESKQDAGYKRMAGEEFLHQGISYRQFSRSWTLADDVVVKDAKMENGMLLIHLEHVVPEEKKPKLIKIS